MSEVAEGNKLALRADYWRYFAGEAARGGDCPLYELLSLAIAGDEAMQRVTLPARPGQPPANMLYAAVHFVLLGGADHPLRLYYSHLLKPGESEAGPGSATYAVFKDFVARYRALIDPLIATRVTNTNEVRRCSYLRAGYAEIASRTGQPLHITELGPSAGLNLNWDRYAYRYEQGEERLEGGLASTLTIDCEWRGPTAPPVPAMHPRVAHRLGLELNRVDLESEADRRWLLALLWPGLVHRMERMKKALAIAVDHIPPIRQGDALAALPGVLETVDGANAAVVTHSMVTYQWTEAMWQQLENLMIEASRARPIHRLFSDRVAKDDNVTVYPLRLRTYRAGCVETELLAEVHPHGAWIAWKG